MGQMRQILPAEDELMRTPGIKIKQKFEMLEALGGCETQNKYTVQAADPDQEHATSNVFMYCKEKSECLHRMCLE